MRSCGDSQQLTIFSLWSSHVRRRTLTLAALLARSTHAISVSSLDPSTTSKSERKMDRSNDLNGHGYTSDTCIPWNNAFSMTTPEQGKGHHNLSPRGASTRQRLRRDYRARKSINGYDAQR